MVRPVDTHFQHEGRDVIAASQSRGRAAAPHRLQPALLGGDSRASACGYGSEDYRKAERTDREPPRWVDRKTLLRRMRGHILPRAQVPAVLRAPATFSLPAVLSRCPHAPPRSTPPRDMWGACTARRKGAPLHLAPSLRRVVALRRGPARAPSLRAARALRPGRHRAARSRPPPPRAQRHLGCLRAACGGLQ